MRHKINYPLPSPSTLVKWAARLDTMRRNTNSSESGSQFLLANCLKSVNMLPSPNETSEELEDTFTDTTLSSRGSPTKKKATEVDGLEYLAGYLAKVFQGKYPWMGSHTYKLKEDDLFHSPSWVSELSRGGLMKPSSEWISIFNKMNGYFEKYNKGTNFRRKSNVTAGMTKLIMSKSAITVDKEVVVQFIRLRTKIRCNEMTKMMKSETEERAREKKLRKLNVN